ncbi:MAG TPA: site-specific integrase [Segeticoccus sp.]|uniref:tyrosine-type recombinase/integrase n=1 Tax=Segeticoccus sp. TaxID=2706531 RepID=UPI002D7FBAA3|nr:site-specific integrase [Segeticoccus sp.]HET8601360.1 site-specific integrase [Segeticoccus sp.]
MTGTPKTHQRRSVPVPRFLTDDLARLGAGKGPEEYLFTAPQGGPLRLMNFRRRVFDPAVRAAGLDGLTPHELRHTAASLAVSAGANVKDVQRMLGHSSAAMTLDVYAGLFEDGLDAVADRMDALAGALADSVRTEGSVTAFPSTAVRAENGPDLRKRAVGQAGLEPATDGL